MLFGMITCSTWNPLKISKRERRKAKVFAVLQDYPDEKIFAEIQRRKGGKEEEKKSIKQAEFEMLQLSQTEIGDDLPDGDFFARSVALQQRHRLSFESESIVVLGALAAGGYRPSWIYTI